MITHNVRHRLCRGLCISMAIIYGWCSSISPARAFAPVAVLAAPQIVTAGASYAVAALAGIVGIIGMYLTIKDATDNEVAIPLGENERNVVPAPAAPATTQKVTTGVCGYWSSQYYPYDALPQGCGGSADEVCPGTMSGGSCYVNDVRYSNWNSTTAQTGCPEGYVDGGTVCKLENARKVTDDKRCDLLLTNGQFATANDLNCSDTADGSKAAPLVRDGKAIVIGKNSSGEPIIVTVSPQSTVNNRDWVEVTVQEQVQTATETQIKKTVATIDPQTSTVTSVSTSTKPGSIVMPSGSSLPTTSPTTDTTTTPTTQTDTDTQGDVTVNTCGLPGQPACAIDDTGFASQPKPWEAEPDGPTLDDIKTKIENLEAPEISWDWLPSILPGQSVQCHPLEFTGTITAGPAAGMTATEPLDLCPYFDYVRMFLGFLFGAGTVMYIWKRFLGNKAEFSAITEYD